MVCSFHQHIALCQDCIHVSVAGYVAGTQISLIVRTHRTKGSPAVLGMDQDLVILGLSEVQNSREHLILYLHQLQSPVHGILRLPGHNGHWIPHIPHMPVQDQPVVGTGLRIRLPGHGEPLCGHVLPGIDPCDPRHTRGGVRLYGLDHGVGVGTPQYLNDQAVPGSQVVHIHRFPRQERHGVLFPDSLIYILHDAPPLFLYSINARIPRSWPS